MVGIQNDVVITVSTPGICIAMCFAEQLGNRKDGQGLLFGAVSREVVEKVTDSGSKTVTRINVDVQAFAQVDFSSKDGFVDAGMVQQAAHCRSQRTIGWFSFRGNTPLRPSMRELHRHAQMEEACKNVDGNLPEQEAVRVPLLLVLLSTSSTKNNSTHSFDHRVLFRENPMQKLRSVDLSITNLRQNSQAEYSSFSASSRVGDDELSRELTQTPTFLIQRLEAFALTKHLQLDLLVVKATEKAQEELDAQSELERLRKRIEELHK